MVPSTIRLLSCLASLLVKSASESGETTLVLIVAIGCSPGISCCDSRGLYILSSSGVTQIVLIDIPCSRLGLSRNCWINSGAWTFIAGSHVSCAGEYPFQRIWYCFIFFGPKRHIPTICSTSHLGSPSTISGGGSKKFGPYLVVSLKRERSNACKTLWIFHAGGSFN